VPAAHNHWASSNGGGGVLSHLRGACWLLRCCKFTQVNQESAPFENAASLALPGALRGGVL
jgi:hypothetical protein